MGIDVERHHYLLSHLNIETVETFLSENREYHLTWVCVMRLNDKILSFPLTTGRSTTPCVECCDYFSL